MNFTYLKNTALAATLLCASLTANNAGAQGLNNSSWSPQAQNRASIAALIRQVEQDGTSSGSTVSSLGTTGSVTQLICGSNSGEGSTNSSNAQANSSCIILNNSGGATVGIDQDSMGDQSSTADADQAVTSTTTVEETINVEGGEPPVEVADDVLATLSGS